MPIRKLTESIDSVIKMVSLG